MGGGRRETWEPAWRVVVDLLVLIVFWAFAIGAVLSAFAGSWDYALYDALVAGGFSAMVWGRFAPRLRRTS